MFRIRSPFLGGIVHSMGFTALNIIICVLNLAYLPVLYILRKIYAYEQLDGQATAAAPIPPPTTNNGTVTQPLTNQNYGLDAEKPAATNPFGGGFTDGYQSAAQTNSYDPLNPQW
jgi:hypothetical protein